MRKSAEPPRQNEKKVNLKKKHMIAQPAYPFRLSDMDGTLHTLADYQDSWLLMVFHRHLG